MQPLQALFLFALLCSCALAQVIELRQSDFDHGTYLIDQPGYYRLAEDIVFNPNNMAQLGVTFYESGRPLPHQFTSAGGQYSPSGFALGFFCAISMYAEDATLDLNGFTLSQAPEHALQQRFFSLIELTNVPFVPLEGPHDFAGGSPVRSARNVVIKNGRLGFNSHHGIHGNRPVNVTIEDLVIRDYDIAAISINGAMGLKVRRVISEGNREDSPIIGIFSAGMFLRPYLNYLLEGDYKGTLRVGGTEMTIRDIHGALRQAILNAHNDIVANHNNIRGGFINAELHPTEYALFHNAFGVVEGNNFGMVFHKPGFATLEFPEVPDDPGAMIRIEDVQIRNVKSSVMEIVSLAGPHNEPVIDAIGAVFQVFNRHPVTGEYITLTSETLTGAMYKGNVVGNAQAFVAKAIHAGAFGLSRLDVTRNTISPHIIDWIEADPSSTAAMLQTLLDQYPSICNGDAMMHVDKGSVGMRLGGLDQVLIRDVVIDGVSNFGAPGSLLCQYDTMSLSNPESRLPGYQGSQSRGMTISGSVNIRLSRVSITGVTAASGSAIGIDVFQDSHDISIEHTTIDRLAASTDRQMIEFTGPNWHPVAIGLRAAETTSRVTISGLRIGGDLSNTEGGLIQHIQNLSSDNDDLLLSSSFSVGDTDTRQSSASSLCMGVALVLIAILA